MFQPFFTLSVLCMVLPHTAVPALEWRRQETGPPAQVRVHLFQYCFILVQSGCLKLHCISHGRPEEKETIREKKTPHKEINKSHAKH